MRIRLLSTLGVALLAGACAGQPTGSAPPVATNSTGPGVTLAPGITPAPQASLDTTPVSATASTDSFEIVITGTPKQALTTTALTPVATFQYLGPDASLKIYHGAPLVVWKLEQIGGTRKMIGGIDTICVTTSMPKGIPVQQPFLKGGEITDDPRVGFDRIFFQQPDLKLPAGRWAISASMVFDLGDCGGQHTELTATVEIEILR